MIPEIHFLGLSIKSFGLMFALAFVVPGIVAAKRLPELGKPRDWAYELLFAALIGGVIGSRVDYVIQNYAAVKNDFWGMIFSGAGLVWYGGLIGGILGIVAWKIFHKFDLLDLFDLAAPALALGYAVGRIGCQLSGDGDYGKPSDLPWAMPYPDGTVPTTEHVQPTPIYETLTMACIGWFLWCHRDKARKGELAALYLILAGVERFLVEFARRNELVFAQLTLPQLFSILSILLGSLLFAFSRRSFRPRAA